MTEKCDTIIIIIAIIIGWTVCLLYSGKLSCMALVAQCCNQHACDSDVQLGCMYCIVFLSYLIGEVQYVMRQVSCCSCSTLFHSHAAVSRYIGGTEVMIVCGCVCYNDYDIHI